MFWPPELFSFNIWDTEIDAEMLDLWALGVTTYMMLTGKSPFRGSSFVDIAASVCTDELQLPDHLSPEAASLVTAMLSKKVEDRPRLSELRNHAFLGGPDTRSAAARGSMFADVPTVEDEDQAIGVPTGPLLHLSREDTADESPNMPGLMPESKLNSTLRPTEPASENTRAPQSLPRVNSITVLQAYPSPPAAGRKSSFLSDGQSKRSSDVSTQNLTAMGSPRPSLDHSERRSSDCLTEPHFHLDVETLLTSQSALGSSHMPHGPHVYRTQFWRAGVAARSPRQVQNPPSCSSRAENVSLPPIALNHRFGSASPSSRPSTRGQSVN
jgi:serine/threonine protein kinase